MAPLVSAAAIVGSAIAPAVADALTFAVPVNYALPPFNVAQGIQDVAVGDFNGDSDPDLAVVHQDGGKVAILLGGAGGTFTGPADNGLYSNANPLWVSIGDFNADSDPDLAVANEGADVATAGVSILAGASGGSFSAATKFAAGPRPQSVGIADFNGDSDLDLAVANETGSSVSVLLGGTGAGFGAATSFTVGTTPRSVVTADFNGDSNKDVAVANKDSNNISILLGNGAGSFGAAANFAAGPTPHALAVGDFNGDADPDLVAVNEVANFASVLLGGAGGSFSAATSYAVGNLPDAVAVGDFNGDADPDFVVANQASDDITVWRGGAGGTFVSPTTHYAGDGPAGVAVGDFNADTYRDIVVANEISNYVTVLLATTPDTTITDGPTAVTNDSTPTFRFSSTDPAATFQCRVGTAAFASCSSPSTTATLTDGTRTFEVRAVDDGGHLDPTPATRSFTVDTLAPQTTIDSGPGAATNNTTPAFTFSSSEAGSTFECRVDTDAFAACTSPYTTRPVGDGSHTFDVRARDQVGNVDPTPATRTFTVDTIPPASPTFTATAPVSPANDNNPEVKGSAEAGSTVRIYANATCTGAAKATGTAAAFTSPGITVSVSDNSTTTLYATAADSLGNASACSSSSIAYVEDSAPPDTTINGGPAGPTNDTTPTFTFSSTDLGSTFECRVDAGAFSSCGSPHTTPSLVAGAHTFDVRAKDPAGNGDASAAGRSFTIDLTPPSAPAITGIVPASPSDDNHPRLVGTAEAGSVVRLHTDPACTGAPNGTGPAAEFGASGVPGTVPDNSTTTFYAAAADAAGNLSACSSTFATYVEVSVPPPSGGIFGPPPAGGLIADTNGPLMSMAGSVLKMDSSGRVSASVTCPASEPGGCEGSVLLETLGKVRASRAARTLKLGSARFKLAGGRSARVKVRLSRKSRRAVTKLRRIKIVALIIARDLTGNKGTARKVLTLRAGKSRGR